MTAATIPVRKWTLKEAAEVFPALSELAEEHGYRLLMFGSVLNKGEGDDLDLQMAPFKATEQSEVRFLAQFGGVLKDSRIDVRRGFRRFKLLRDGRLYDFNFGGFWKPRGTA